MDLEFKLLIRPWKPQCLYLFYFFNSKILTHYRSLKMSQFSEQSIKRIAASVDYTEGIRRNGGSYPPPIADESRDLCWVELQYDLNNTGCPEVTSTRSEEHRVGKEGRTQVLSY